ncbi:MAG: TetR/AcrR family transcriptional regulator [Verrucomicrobiota bacterium]|jgi:AcrR family transcriptional regulator
MPEPSEQDRQSRILDAAENALAELGFAGASLRHIVLEARVNLATVYYYFGSKRGLMEAVLKRRFGPLRQEHLALLRQFEEAAKGRPLSVEKILEAMLLPPLRLAATAPAKHQAVTRLFGRIVSEPNPQTQEMLRSQRAEVRAAFLKALQRSLPRAPLPDLLWRVEFVWGALAFTLCNPRKFEVETHGACDPADTNNVLAEMIRFFSPGFHALARGKRKL